MGVHSEVGCILTDNGTEWVNEDFRTMLVDLGIARELTAVNGPRSNGLVEWRIALISEGAKAAFVEFPNLPRHYFSRSHKVLRGHLAGGLHVDERLSQYHGNGVQG